MPMTRVRYSKAFKRQVVSEVESGRYRSQHAVARIYSIGAMTTVARWVRQYGREDFLPRKVRIETLKERDELKESRKRIRDIEIALADAHIECCIEKAYVHVVCDRMGVDPDSEVVLNL